MNISKAKSVLKSVGVEDTSICNERNAKDIAEVADELLDNFTIEEIAGALAGSLIGAYGRKKLFSL